MAVDPGEFLGWDRMTASAEVKTDLLAKGITYEELD